MKDNKLLSDTDNFPSVIEALSDSDDIVIDYHGQI